MARQPFERKSLWLLSAPCYHIHISMGDNFETACTAPRTNVPAGACRDENVSSCLQSLPVAVHLSKAPTACIKGCPGSSGCHRPSLCERKQLGREGSRLPAGVSRAGPLYQALQPDRVLNMSELRTLAHRRLSPGCRRTQQLPAPPTNWSKFQTWKRPTSL